MKKTQNIGYNFDFVDDYLRKLNPPSSQILNLSNISNQNSNSKSNRSFISSNFVENPQQNNRSQAIRQMLNPSCEKLVKLNNNNQNPYNLDKLTDKINNLMQMNEEIKEISSSKFSETHSIHNKSNVFSEKSKIILTDIESPSKNSDYSRDLFKEISRKIPMKVQKKMDFNLPQIIDENEEIESLLITLDSYVYEKELKEYLDFSYLKELEEKTQLENYEKIELLEGYLTRKLNEFQLKTRENSGISTFSSKISKGNGQIVIITMEEVRKILGVLRKILDKRKKKKEHEKSEMPKFCQLMDLEIKEKEERKSMVKKEKENPMKIEEINEDEKKDKKMSQENEQEAGKIRGSEENLEKKEEKEDGKLMENEEKIGEEKVGENIIKNEIIEEEFMEKKEIIDKKPETTNQIEIDEVNKENLKEKYPIKETIEEKDEEIIEEKDDPEGKEKQLEKLEKEQLQEESQRQDENEDKKEQNQNKLPIDNQSENEDNKIVNEVNEEVQEIEEEEGKMDNHFEGEQQNLENEGIIFQNKEFKERKVELEEENVEIKTGKEGIQLTMEENQCQNEEKELKIKENEEFQSEKKENQPENKENQFENKGEEMLNKENSFENKGNQFGQENNNKNEENNVEKLQNNYEKDENKLENKENNLERENKLENGKNQFLENEENHLEAENQPKLEPAQKNNSKNEENPLKKEELQVETENEQFKLENEEIQLEPGENHLEDNEKQMFESNKENQLEKGVINGKQNKKMASSNHLSKEEISFKQEENDIQNQRNSLEKQLKNEQEQESSIFKVKEEIKENEKIFILDEDPKKGDELIYEIGTQPLLKTCQENIQTESFKEKNEEIAEKEEKTVEEIKDDEEKDQRQTQGEQGSIMNEFIEMENLENIEMPKEKNKHLEKEQKKSNGENTDQEKEKLLEKHDVSPENFPENYEAAQIMASTPNNEKLVKKSLEKIQKSCEKSKKNSIKPSTQNQDESIENTNNFQSQEKVQKSRESSIKPLTPNYDNPNEFNELVESKSLKKVSKSRTNSEKNSIIEAQIENKSNSKEFADRKSLEKSLEKPAKNSINQNQSFENMRDCIEFRVDKSHGKIQNNQENNKKDSFKPSSPSSTKNLEAINNENPSNFNPSSNLTEIPEPLQQNHRSFLLKETIKYLQDLYPLSIEKANQELNCFKSPLIKTSEFIEKKVKSSEILRQFSLTKANSRYNSKEIEEFDDNVDITPKMSIKEKTKDFFLEENDQQNVDFNVINHLFPEFPMIERSDNQENDVFLLGSMNKSENSCEKKEVLPMIKPANFSRKVHSQEIKDKTPEKLKKTDIYQSQSGMKKPFHHPKPLVRPWIPKENLWKNPLFNENIMKTPSKTSENKNFDSKCPETSIKKSLEKIKNQNPELNLETTLGINKNPDQDPLIEENLRETPQFFIKKYRNFIRNASEKLPHLQNSQKNSHHPQKASHGNLSFSYHPIINISKQILNKTADNSEETPIKTINISPDKTSTILSAELATKKPAIKSVFSAKLPEKTQKNHHIPKILNSKPLETKITENALSQKNKEKFRSYLEKPDTNLFLAVAKNYIKKTAIVYKAQQDIEKKSELLDKLLLKSEKMPVKRAKSSKKPEIPINNRIVIKTFNRQRSPISAILRKNDKITNDEKAFLYSKSYLQEQK